MLKKPDSKTVVPETIRDKFINKTAKRAIDLKKDTRTILGNTLIVAEYDKDSGGVNVYDCEVKRQGYYSNPDTVN